MRAGQSDPHAPNIDFHAFYPDQVRVHPGDTIASPDPGPEHSVTFGVTPARVQAGLAVTEASVQSFFPQQITVRVGQAVTWTNTSYDPHVIDLGEHLGTQDPRDFGPPTRPPGGDVRSGVES